MNIASTVGRIAAVVATVSALTTLAGVAQAGTSRPSTMSEAAYRALQLRSEALNQEYLMVRREALDREQGLGARGAVLKGMTAAASRALMLRSEALNERYGLGQSTTTGAAPTPAPLSAGFSWTAFGTGAGAVTAFVAVLAGAIAARRFGHRIPRPRISS